MIAWFRQKTYRRGEGEFVVKGSKGMLAYQTNECLGGLVQLSNNLVSTYYLCVQVDISEREKRERNICQKEHFIGAAHCIRKSAACACAE